MRHVIRTAAMVLLSLVMLAACASGGPEIFDEEFASADTENVDLEGVTIRYVKRGGDGDNQVLGYELDTVLGDLAMQRIRNVQNGLNCVFDIEYAVSGDPYSVFNMYNSTGTYYCDIFSGISDMFRQAMKSGALIGLSELDGFLDYRNENKWGKRDTLEPLYWEDEVYGLVPMLWPTSSVSYQGLMIVNEDLVAAVGGNDPRDLFENRQWTWATLRDCLERYYVQEGTEVKQYSLTHQYKGDLGRSYLLSNGYRLAEKGPDGNYVSGLRDTRALTAMNEAIDIATGPLAHTVDFNVKHIDALTGNRTVLGVLHEAEYLSDIVKEMNNFGVLTFPSGPDVEPGFISTTTQNLGNVIVISRFSNNIEATAIALNALYEPFEEYPDSDSVKEFLFSTYFFDRRDADIYYELFLNTQFSYFSSPVWNTLHEWFEGGWVPSEYIESHLEKVEQYIADEIAPSKRGVESVWGEQ